MRIWPHLPRRCAGWSGPALRADGGARRQAGWAHGAGLPAPAAAVVARVAERALNRALDIALFSLRDGRLSGGRVVHSALASASGAVGGPLGSRRWRSSCRSRRDHAARDRRNRPRGGRGPCRPAHRSCLSRSVCARPAREADAAAGIEGGYFAVRAVLARGLAQAADIVVDKGTLHGGSAMAMRFLSPIVARFGAVVSEKLAAQAVAVVGAVGGAVVNLAFIEHFQELGARPFHRAPARTRLWRRGGARRIRPSAERGRGGGLTAAERCRGGRRKKNGRA